MFIYQNRITPSIPHRTGYLRLMAVARNGRLMLSFRARCSREAVHRRHGILANKEDPVSAQQHFML
jgi:hypothetical protein